MHQPGMQPDANHLRRLLVAIETVIRIPAPAPGTKGEDGERGLRGNAKVAYIQALLDAGGYKRTWSIHYASLGAKMGTGYDGGRKAAAALDRFGLWDVTERGRGEATIFIRDPQEATKAWRSRTAGDCDQGELYSSWEPNSPSEDVAAESGPATVPLSAGPPGPEPEPARLAEDQPVGARFLRETTEKPARLGQDEPVEHGTSARARLLTSNIKHLPSKEDVPDVGCPREQTGSSSARQADSPRLSPDEYSATVRMLEEKLAKGEPTAMGGVFGAIAAKVDPAPGRRAQKAIEWVERIRREVNDKFLAKYADGRTSLGGQEMIEDIAWKVTSGELPEPALEAAFRALQTFARKGKIRECYHDGSPKRAAVFIGIMRNVYADQEPALQWARKPRRERSC